MIPPPESFDNCVPIRVYWREGTPFVDWCYLGRERFTRPFFENTIRRQLQNPFSLLFRHQTPLDFLAEFNGAHPAPEPTGFIFHMSRCGSTLATQMLASLPQNIVISEAPPINTILRLNLVNPAVTDEQRIAGLRGLITALGRKRNPEESHYFIKFDSWSTIDLDLIGRAFPDVPWAFFYRDPVEVIVSQMFQRGAQMIPGTIEHLLPGLDFHQVLQLPAEEYCARVLSLLCESVIHQLSAGKNGKALLINYSQLPEAITSVMLAHFGVSYPAEDMDKMNAAAQFDAKTPQMTFVPDGESKKAAASEATVKAAGGNLNFLYEKLEAMRLGQTYKNAA